MDIEVRLQLPPYQTEFVDKLTALSEIIFGAVAPDYIDWRLHNMPKSSVFVSEKDREFVAFKIGYAMSKNKYYSWLGGVHPNYRRNGLASTLMIRQHHWVANQGYILIETATNQENTGMAKLNLSNGFSVCGTRTEPSRTQILYLKALGS